MASAHTQTAPKSSSWSVSLSPWTVPAGGTLPSPAAPQLLCTTPPHVPHTDRETLLPDALTALHAKRRAAWRQNRRRFLLGRCCVEAAGEPPQIREECRSDAGWGSAGWITPLRERAGLVAPSRASARNSQGIQITTHLTFTSRSN